MFQFLQFGVTLFGRAEFNFPVNPIFICHFYSSCVALNVFQRVLLRLEIECGLNSIAAIIRLNKVFEFLTKRKYISEVALENVYYFAPYSKYGSKIFFSNALFLTFFLLDVCQLRSRHIGKFVHATEREIIF